MEKYLPLKILSAKLNTLSEEAREWMIGVLAILAVAWQGSDRFGVRAAITLCVE